MRIKHLVDFQVFLFNFEKDLNLRLAFDFYHDQEHCYVAYRADEISIAFLGICYICGSLFLGVVAYGLYILTQLVCFIYLTSDSRLTQEQKIVSHAFRAFSSNSKVSALNSFQVYENSYIVMYICICACMRGWFKL